MKRTTIMATELNSELKEFVLANVSETGLHENVCVCIRDLVCHDKERLEKELFENLKAELARAFAAPDTSFFPLSASEVIARNRK